jgi:hypothetical protein
VTPHVLTSKCFLIFQAKQIQIDDLFSKLDSSSAVLERLRDEKDQEIAILQEGMDHTIQQLSEAQQVRLLCLSALSWIYWLLDAGHCSGIHKRADRHPDPR